jgi:hypothetical protein
MSICPRLGVEVPELTARVARASNPAGTRARRAGSATSLTTWIDTAPLVITQSGLSAHGHPRSRPGSHTRSADSTEVYAAVAIEPLREVALGHGEQVPPYPRPGQAISQP